MTYRGLFWNDLVDNHTIDWGRIDFASGEDWRAFARIPEIHVSYERRYLGVVAS